MNRIVVVEDDTTHREFVVRCLASRGHLVIVAENGEEGLGRIMAEETAVVVTDIHMPGLDGFGLADALRREPGIRQPDIIFMSSDMERNLYRRALQLGACDFLTKPFACNELVEAITARLDARQTAPPVSAPPPAAGMRKSALPEIAGYRIIRRLGEGTTSQVYLVTPRNSATPHALKLMRLSAETGLQREEISRFLTEYAMLAGLSHPNVATVYSHGVTDDYLYLDMEYVAGGDLSLDIKNGMTHAAAQMCAAELASALSVIHAAGIVHRDLKPANVLMRMSGEAVLADFGIAKHITSRLALTQQDIAIGTPYYMSPEQATAGAIDARSDLYTLGIVLFEMLTGKHPYHGFTSHEVMAQHLNAPVPRLPEAAAAFQTVIERLLAKRVDDRYADANEARAAILGVTI